MGEISGKNWLLIFTIGLLSLQIKYIDCCFCPIPTFNACPPGFKNEVILLASIGTCAPCRKIICVPINRSPPTTRITTTTTSTTIITTTTPNTMTTSTKTTTQATTPLTTTTNPTTTPKNSKITTTSITSTTAPTTKATIKTTPITATAATTAITTLTTPITTTSTRKNPSTGTTPTTATTITTTREASTTTTTSRTSTLKSTTIATAQLTTKALTTPTTTAKITRTTISQRETTSKTLTTGVKRTTKLVTTTQTPIKVASKPAVTSQSTTADVPTTTKLLKIIKDACVVNGEKIESGMKVLFNCIHICACRNGKLKNCNPLCSPQLRQNCRMDDIEASKKLRKFVKKGLLDQSQIDRCTNHKASTTARTEVTTPKTEDPINSLRLYIFIGIAIILLIILVCVGIMVCRCFQLRRHGNNEKHRRRSSSWMKTRKLPTVPGTVSGTAPGITTGDIPQHRDVILNVDNTNIDVDTTNTFHGTPVEGGLRLDNRRQNRYEPSPIISRRENEKHNSSTTKSTSIYDSVNKIHYAHLEKMQSLQYQDLTPRQGAEYLEMGSPIDLGFYDDSETKRDDELYENYRGKERSSSYSLLNQGYQDNNQEYQSLDKESSFMCKYTTHYEQPVDGFPTNRRSSYEDMHGDNKNKLTKNVADYEDVTSYNDSKNRRQSLGVLSMNNESCHYEVPPEIGSFHPEYFDEGKDYENDYVESYLDLTDD